MGVMDFLKGLFSSNKEDQSVNNNPEEVSPLEPAPEEPQVESNSENIGGAEDSNIQE